MSADQLQRLFEINDRAFHLNVGGLTHDESLIQPPRGGNCLNWVAGHIVANRSFVLTLLGEKPIWTDEDAAPYKRGSPPIKDGARAPGRSRRSSRTSPGARSGSAPPWAG